MVLARRQRFRRPRWTPEVRYVEATDVAGDAGGEDEAGEDAVTGDFLP